MSYCDLVELLNRITHVIAGEIAAGQEQCPASILLFRDFWIFLFEVVQCQEYYFVRSGSLLAAQYLESLPTPVFSFDSSKRQPTIKVQEVIDKLLKVLTRMMLTARETVRPECGEVKPDGYTVFKHTVQKSIHFLS